jgi:mediator of RNA polymerase II transcription subunit 7
MADAQSTIPSAPFPAPPPFWKHFTSANLSRLRALKESNNNPEDGIPSELTYLEPPPFPTDSYTIFNEAQTVCFSPTLLDPSMSTLHY